MGKKKNVPVKKASGKKTVVKKMKAVRKKPLSFKVVSTSNEILTARIPMNGFFTKRFLTKDDHKFKL